MRDCPGHIVHFQQALAKEGIDSEEVGTEFQNAFEMLSGRAWIVLRVEEEKAVLDMTEGVLGEELECFIVLGFSANNVALPGQLESQVVMWEGETGIEHASSAEAAN